jgi:hypothetical protein
MAKRNDALKAIGSNPGPEGAAVVSLHAERELAPQAQPAPPKAKDVDKVMLYLPPKVARKFKEIAFHEDCKAHDVYMRALAAYLRGEGHGAVADLIKR